MSAISQIIMCALGVPKTIYFNFKCFPVRIAIKLPVFISHRVRFKVYKNCININADIKTGMIIIGMENGSFAMAKQKKSYIGFNSNCKGKITFNGKCRIANGVIINISNGNIIFGNNFTSNANLLVSCANKIQFGDNNIIGWNCSFLDNDGHKILKDNIQVNITKPIIIGDNVWFSANSSVLKGASIANNTVVAYNSCVLNKFKNGECIIGGYPAKIIKEKITWEK